MNLKIVQSIQPFALTTSEVHAELSNSDGVQVVVIARDDYYDDGGTCYSRIELTRENIEQLLALFPASAPK